MYESQLAAGYATGLVMRELGVTAAGFVSGPDLDFVQPRFWRDDEEARERNREVVRDSVVEDWLPTVTTYDAQGEESGTAPLLDCATVTVPDTDDAALGTMDPEDSAQQHAADTLAEGYWLGHPRIVEQLVDGAPQAVQELEEWGARFHHEADGREGG